MTHRPDQRPRILFYCDRPGWAYHTTASQLMAHLADRYNIDLIFAQDFPEFDANDYDLIYVFWWGERRHRAHLPQGRKVVKEISSHRWQYQEEFGLSEPREMDARWMTDASHLVVTSRRLAKAFEGIGKPVGHYALGVDPNLFHPGEHHAGELVLGWAGNPSDPAKRFQEIVRPLSERNPAFRIADGSLPTREMPDFYRSLDVILIASVAEGTPLPLIEAMACGCFPVSTDAGVAPELIKHGINGLIVEPTLQAFSDAIDWCREHPETVRAAGAANAELIRNERTWQHSAASFAGILENIMNSENSHSSKMEPSASTTGRAAYERHFDRINPDGFSEQSYQGTLPHIRRDIAHLLPRSRDAKILEIGTGHGHLIHFLSDERYRRIFGIDVNEPMLREVLKRNAHQVESLEVADALDYLPCHQREFDCIVMLDVIEHFSLDDARTVLVNAANALRGGGRLILRTPNMANILGGYSRYMDLTHHHGYTEWSLIHLLDQCGLPGAQVSVPSNFPSRKQQLKHWINEQMHKLLFRLHDRAEPKCFAKNIVVWAEKPEHSEHPDRP